MHFGEREKNGMRINEGENERENKEDRKGGPDVEYRFSSSPFPLLSALSRASRDEKAGRFGSREWIIINRYFRQSRPFILRHATPIIYRRFGRWREGERSKYKGSEGEGEKEREKNALCKGRQEGRGKKDE